MSEHTREGWIRWTPVIVVILSLVGNIMAIGRNMEKLDEMDRRVTKLETSQDIQEKAIVDRRVEETAMDERYKAILDKIDQLRDGQKKLEDELRRTHPGYSFKP